MIKIKASKFNWFEISIVAILIFVFLFLKIKQVPFHPDESNNIYASSYFEKLFEFDPSLWNENYWTLTQPPFIYFLVGISRWIFGYTIQALPCSYDFLADLETNIINGCVPNDDLLFVARLPILLFTGIGLLSLYIILVKSTGRGAGFIFLLTFMLNPYLTNTLLLAKMEGPHLFFLSVILYMMIQGIGFGQHKISNEGKFFISPQVYAYLAILGIVIGLLTEVKINGVLIGFSVCTLLLMIIFLFPNGLSEEEKIIFSIRGIFTIFISALFTFILLNPYLYSDPFNKIGRMFKWRVHEISEQLVSYPEAIVPNGLTRFPFVFNKIFIELSIFTSKSIKLLFIGTTIGGLIFLVKRSLLWFKGKSPSNFHYPVILIIPLPFVIMSWLTPLDWDRYYLFAVIYNMILSSIYLEVLFRKLGQINFQKKADKI